MNFMKPLFQSVLACLLTCVLAGMSSCSNDKADEQLQPEGDEVKVTFVFTLDTSAGSSMHRAAKTNAEVFNEFYAKIKTAELVAPTYELTLTEQASGTTYTFNGRWDGHDVITLRTGTYRVTGRSIADGESVQDKCSFIFDETVTIDASSSTVTLHADYDCFLLIFNNPDISRLSNNNGQTSTALFTLGDYRYAFVRDQLYLDDYQTEASIEGSMQDGSTFRIYTGKLQFESGKYYVYNVLTNSFDVPPMEEGDTTGESGSDEDDPSPDDEKPSDDDPSNTGITIDMISVPSGSFLMGSADDDTDAQDDERPQHMVTVSAFSIGRYEVTQQQWLEVMGTNPAYFQGSKVTANNTARPVEMVNMTEVNTFIQKLNQLTGLNYRLPTEEEWEYAARGGQTSAFRYAGSNNVADVAWYKDNSGAVTHPVNDTSKQPNALGIYGMSGNVWEWTSTLRTDSYETSAAVNSAYYVVRGGSYQNAANSCRVAFRHFYKPSERRNYIGLRLAMDAQ